MASTSPPRTGTPCNMMTSADARRLGLRWRIEVISFKIGYTIFTVDRDPLLNASPVLRALVPSDRSEGTPDRPIVLEGYKAEDFAMLFNAIYPTLQDVMSGTNFLTKGEWIRVSRLAKALEMRKVRECAKQALSEPTPVLSAIEKVKFGHELGISSWLEEGLAALLIPTPQLTPDKLEEALGLRLAFRIVALQSQLLLKFGDLIGRVSKVCFPLAAMKCARCENSKLLGSVRCNCFSPLSKVSAYVARSTLPDPWDDGSSHIFAWDSVKCSSCNQALFAYGRPQGCASWGGIACPGFSLTGVSPPKVPQEIISCMKDTFRDELAQCDM